MKPRQKRVETTCLMLDVCFAPESWITNGKMNPTDRSYGCNFHCAVHKARACARHSGSRDVATHTMVTKSVIIKYDFLAEQ